MPMDVGHGKWELMAKGDNKKIRGGEGRKTDKFVCKSAEAYKEPVVMIFIAMYF